MNTHQIFSQYLTYFALIGGISCVAFIVGWSLRNQLRIVLDRWFALGPLGRCVTAVFATVFIIYGSTKSPESTNEPPDLLSGGSFPTNSPQLQMLGNPRLVLNPPRLLSPLAPGLAMTTNSQWLARGAWNDWTRIEFPDDFAFPLGTNLLSGVTLMSQGALRGILANSAAFVELPAALSLEPDVSSVAYGLTDSNSFLFAWSNACIDREATNRVDAAIELFESGDMMTRFGETVTYIPRQLPEGFVGSGQDAAWVTNAFPQYVDAIATNGYSSWLLNDYVGINEQNGRYMASITIDSLPDVGPCYLVCGPHRVVVTSPGTYSFPLEVFETYTVRTYPTALPLTITTDDGYRGSNPTPNLLMSPPRLMSLPGSQHVDNIFDICEQPRLVITPNHVPLSQAVGTRISIWCNMANATRRFVAETAGEFYMVFCSPTQAEINECEVEALVEILVENPSGVCRGTIQVEETNPGIYPGTNDCTNVSSTNSTSSGTLP